MSQATASLSPSTQEESIKSENSDQLETRVERTQSPEQKQPENRYISKKYQSVTIYNQTESEDNVCSHHCLLDLKY